MAADEGSQGSQDSTGEQENDGDGTRGKNEVEIFFLFRIYSTDFFSANVEFFFFYVCVF